VAERQEVSSFEVDSKISPYWQGYDKNALLTEFDEVNWENKKRESA